MVLIASACPRSVLPSVRYWSTIPLWTVLVVCLLMINTGCNHRGHNFHENTIVVAVSSEPNRLNPVFLSDSTSFTLSGWIFNGLTRLDDNLSVAGDLAESWAVSEDGLTITFHLRKGVKWHDGKEFSSRDVLFTFDSITSSTVVSPRSSQFEAVCSIRAPDAYTVVVRYREPYGSALMSWTIGILPEHIFRNRNVDSPSFDRSPVGTGPYRLREWVSGEKLVFEAFGRHFSGSPKIKHVVVRIIPDASTRLLELKKGGIDMMELTPLQFAKQTDSEFIALHFVKHRSPSFRYAFLGFNLRDDRFKAMKVREAIGYAIDREAIIDSVLFGLGKKSTGPYPPGVWYDNAGTDHIRYDPQKGAAALDEAGWLPDDTGLRRKGNKPFVFTILTNYENEENIKISQIIQSNLKALGVRVTINQLEWQAFRHDVINGHAFEAIVLSRAYVLDPDLFELWHSSRRREGDWNFMSYQSPAADALLEKGRKTRATSERARLYKRFHQVIAHEKPCLFLYDADGLFIVHKRIKGVKPSIQGIYHNLSDFFL